ncbi:MAG: DUF523 domain-containing protein [Solobacterium sp.]|nr:DUF523 domain-containing protein [Solobacterium sp.]
MILVSKCLAGVPCRMDGQSKGIEEIRKLVEEGKAVAACPEVLGGLPTPRDPGELVNGRVITCNGQDVTEEYVRGAEKALAIYREHHCTMAVLKSRSPSCGIGLVHNGLFDGGMTEGNGIFAQKLIAEGIPCMDEHAYLQLLKK